MNSKTRWLLLSLGGGATLYAIAVLIFVAASPDLHLRCLISSKHSKGDSVPIYTLDNLESEIPVIQSGDQVQQLGNQKVQSFLDVMRGVSAIHGADIPPGGLLDEGESPGDQSSDLLPWLVEEQNGSRWVKVLFSKKGTGQTQTTWLKVKTVTFWQLAMSLFWFLLELAILTVSAMAFWYRPFDRTVRLFFVMCFLTMGAFIGGYDWWLLSRSPLFSAPFALCAIFLPAATLHFFLVYPRPGSSLQQAPRTVLTLLYFIPIVASLAILTYFGWASWYLRSVTSVELQHVSIAVLRWLSFGIRVYMGIAALYFGLTVGTLILRFVTTDNPVERNQMRWILWAGLFACLPICYALYLAQFDRAAFISGKARIPMFLASLSFLLAYAVGIVRYKLILVDQIISKGISYYAATLGTLFVFSGLIASLSLVGQFYDFKLSLFQMVAIGFISVISIILLMSFRDVIQQAIDQRFFREKYQLDRALQRMNRAVGHLIQTETLSSMMLSSCRDVLLVDRAAFYSRDENGATFQLVAAEGVNRDELPLHFPADPVLLEELNSGVTLQRNAKEQKEEMTPVQGVLHLLGAKLIHQLPSGDTTSVIVLGEKSDSHSFTAEDLTFLNALGQITTVALQSTTAHQNLSQMSDELTLKNEKISDLHRQITLLQTELSIQQEGNITENTTTKTETADNFQRDLIRGNSPTMQSVLDTVRKVAASESTVMIRGESGTGKELLARVIHQNSSRRDRPMVTVNCASLAPSLLESELFGHTKGAFTGAHKDKQGRFEAANGGTLFLDEIGDVSVETQIKLLRVLQERCFEPVGGTRTVNVDVRLITATNRNLEQLIEEGKFREDFFYRLNVIGVELPPLRERREDMMELAIAFLKKSAHKNSKQITHIAGDAFSALEQHHWPGNVRELENAIERAVVLTENNAITLDDLPAELRQKNKTTPKTTVLSVPLSLQKTNTKPLQQPPLQNQFAERESSKIDPNRLDERTLLKEALQQSSGNKAQAARLLGMPRSTYYSKLKKHGISGSGK
ncbi:Response regulator of zinc sigma-54-dependent two-component system [hydrothermal vent metagenome]|uniref:Response regulator of zinc sigma-54-dependent two-component system n=1 Tax=hydrothermal vent metagenome TaxID=652676 RepID=A0A3B1D9S8_9ZZZZ